MQKEKGRRKKEGKACQGLKSLANSLSHLKMTLEEYAIFFIFLYCG
ncbi:MAG: hypothetical protein F6K17_41930 [Okeania sp. SIO3C4]|nr:hypothetical protein [Okeania sp. SIO3C4]